MDLKDSESFQKFSTTTQIWEISGKITKKSLLWAYNPYYKFNSYFKIIFTMKIPPEVS